MYRSICRINLCKKGDYTMLVMVICISVVVGAAAYTWAKDAKDGINR